MELKIENGVVKGLNDKGYKGKVEIPSYVTAIDAEAFADCGEITEVELSEDLVFIGKFAFFNCKKLKTVSFGKRIKEIGRSAFQNCEALEKAELQYGIAEIEPWTFAGCKSLKEVVIPNGVKHIGHQAFVDCSSLETIDLRSIELYEDVYDEPVLGYDVFQNVNPKCKIIVPLYADEKYKEAAQWNVFDDIVVNKEKIFYHHGLRYRAFEEEEETEEKRRKIVVTDNKDFVGSANIESEIKFDDLTLTVCSIDRDAFKGNKELTSVTIPETLETIGLGAFAFCTRLEHFKCDNELGNKGNYVAEEGVLFEKTENKTMDKLVAYPAANGREAYSIPPSVTKIEDYAFSSIHSLVRIVFPNKEYDIQGTHVFDQADSHNDYLSNCWAFIPKNAVGLKKTLEELGFKLFNTDSFSEGGLNYRIISDDKEHKVEVADNKDFAGDLKVPGKVKFAGVEYTVVGIGAGAFERNTKITSVDLADTIKSIGTNAFLGVKNTNAIVLPSSLEGVGLAAFNSSRITFANLDLPSGLKEIKHWAFAGSTINTKKVTIPASVLSMEYGMFRGSVERIDVNSSNPKYKSVDGVLFSKDGKTLIEYPNARKDTSYVIPSQVEIIEKQAFCDCANLKTITIPNTVKSIGSQAFSSCSSLSRMIVEAKEPPAVVSAQVFGVPSTCYVQVPKGYAKAYKEAEIWKLFGDRIFDEIPTEFTSNNIKYRVVSLENKTVEVADNKNASGAIVIPEKVTHYGEPYTVVGIVQRAFSGNGKITDITLPDTIITIGEGAFVSVSSKKSIFVPKSLERVESGAFNSSTLTFANLDLPSGLKEIEHWAFASTNVVTKRVTIPASVQSMEYGMFRGSVERIDVNSGNPNYKSIDGVLFSKDGKTLIEYPNARKDTSYVIPSQVEIIEKQAFCKCANLKTITIPNTVKSIGSQAFNNCSSLILLVVNAVTPPTNAATVNSNCIIQVPKNCVDKYKAAEGWKQFASSIVDNPNPEFPMGNINYKVLSFADRTVEVAKSPNASGALTIPSQVAYSGIQFTVVGIGDSAFDSNKKVTSVSLPNTIKYVGYGAFQTLVVPMVLPSSLEKVGRYAFTYNVFNDLTLPSGLKEMGDSAFAYTTVKSEKVYIPVSVMSVEGTPFYGSDIKEIKVDPNNKNYKSLSGVLLSKDGLKLITYPKLKADKTYTIPNGVTTIGCYSFVNQNLTKLVIPTSVNQLEDAALWSCWGLKTLEVQSTTPPKVEEKSFNGVPADCLIRVPVGCAAKYTSANGWKNFINIVTGGAA